MSYQEIRIPEELDRAVQRAVGIIPRWHETLGEAVRDIATQRGVRRPEREMARRRRRCALTSTPSPPEKSTKSGRRRPCRRK
jgi:5-methylcytosine-specific restriction endonuclease McrA